MAMNIGHVHVRSNTIEYDLTPEIFSPRKFSPRKFSPRKNQAPQRALTTVAPWVSSRDLPGYDRIPFRSVDPPAHLPLSSLNSLFRTLNVRESRWGEGRGHAGIGTNSRPLSPLPGDKQAQECPHTLIRWTSGLFPLCSRFSLASGSQRESLRQADLGSRGTPPLSTSGRPADARRSAHTPA